MHILCCSNSSVVWCACILMVRLKSKVILPTGLFAYALTAKYELYRNLSTVHLPDLL